MCKEFEMICEQSAHAQEIASSRVGCLGGSDAAMVLKIGRKGIKALSNTDKKRLFVMLGKMEQQAFGGNAATKAGHDYEEYMAKICPNDEREVRLEGARYAHFQCIAHADLYNASRKRVRELKCSKDKTEKVLQKYYAQLQWYYMLGVEAVELIHGESDVESVDGFITHDILPVDADAQVIGELYYGLELIDEWCKTAKIDELQEQDEADDTLRNLLIQYETKKMVVDSAEKELTGIREKVLLHMQENGIESSRCGNIQVTYKNGSTQRRLDSAKLQKKYPHIASDEDVWKSVEVKGSVTIKISNNESENN